MAIFAPIPMPENGMDAFLEGMAKSQSMFDSLMQNRLRAAQTQRELKLAQLPFGGAEVPGPAGQIVGLEMIRGAYGENSPQYQTALKAFNLGQESTGARIGYETALTHSMPLRYTTPEGRQIIEESNVNQGYSPAGTPQGMPVAPGKAPYHPPSQGADNSSSPMTPEGRHYALRQTKQDLPASVMSKNLYANNIDKTIENINLDDLTHYNGPMGQFKLKSEQALDAAGQDTSPEYQKYKEAEAKFNFLTNQVRQFYGDSIQPSAMEKLQEKIDPRGAFRSSKIGKAAFNSAKDLLKKELQTYRDASRDASVYQGTSPSLPAVNESDVEGQASPEGTIWMIRPDGMKVPVHKENVRIAVEKYKFKPVT